MDNLGIFIFGCGVFGIAIAATFCALIASDRPNKKQQSDASLRSARKQNSED